MTGVPPFDEVAGLVRARRTSMVVDRERAVPDDLLDQLCELVTWAPCHKRTWPWQLAVFTGQARARLGETAADAMEARGDEPARVAKARTKYLRTPAVVVVGATEGDTPLRTVENRDAVSAGVQNLLLGATAAGLASYWSSCPKDANDPVATLCGFEAGTTVVAIVYLGWPAATEVATPQRPPLHVRRPR